MSKKHPPPKNGPSYGKPMNFGQAVRGLVREPLTWLLLTVPLAVALEYAHADPTWIFLVSGLAIVPLAGLMGRATENLAETLGPGVGGLLNATFGNAAELIIALMVIRQGPEMYPLVKATITGSIIGNILLVLGLAVLMGGFFHNRQVFNRVAASMGSSLLALAAVGLIVPSIAYNLLPKDQRGSVEAYLSTEIAVVLAVVYVLSLLFSLRTHRHLFAGGEGDLPTTGEHHQPEWRRSTSLLILLAATAGVAVMSEFLVGSIKPATAALHMNEVFVGVIVVAIIGNAAEHSTAVLVAMKNKMDLALNIAVGSSLQIALFVAPVLVFASLLMHPGTPLDLHFTIMELIAVVLSVLILGLVSQDGESHWLEGAMLLAVYVIFGLAFYHLPPGTW